MNEENSSLYYHSWQVWNDAVELAGEVLRTEDWGMGEYGPVFIARRIPELIASAVAQGQTKKPGNGLWQAKEYLARLDSALSVAATVERLHNEAWLTSEPGILEAHLEAQDPDTYLQDRYVETFLPLIESIFGQLGGLTRSQTPKD